MKGENSHIAMEDDPKANADVAEQGHRGDKDAPGDVERERGQQSGGERGKLPKDDAEETRQSDR
jgi:hypothetical protein